MRGNFRGGSAPGSQRVGNRVPAAISWRFRRTGWRVANITVQDVALEIAEAGSGPPLLLLHGIAGPLGGTPVFRALAPHARVVAPSHPGYGGSPLPDWIDRIDDLAFLYLDLIEAMGLSEVCLVGCSFGGWVAAEMAVKSTQRLKRLVLVNSFGIKIGDRESRDIPDIFALHPDEVSKLIWHDRKLAPDIAAMSDEAVERMVRDQEAAALYLWEPYMHNPKLRRWLHRIDVPTLLLRGAHDGLVSPPLAQAMADAIPGARLETIAGAGHAPEFEQPHILAERLERFLGLVGA